MSAEDRPQPELNDDMIAKTETVLCVRCLRAPATIFGGHITVTSTDRRVLAGWCEPCHTRHDDEDRRGWSGHYIPEMGERTRTA